jgi:hypothetical protein
MPIKVTSKNPVVKTLKPETILKISQGSIKRKEVRCCICNIMHDRESFGCLEEHGRGRRFCPDCSRDILLSGRNCIHDDDFPPDEY